jgi:hypothetical protein
MVTVLDVDSVERLREMTPREAYHDVKRTIFRAGGVTSDDFQSAFDQLIEAGILTWEQIEEFERD